jgi:hypothetical protein
LITPKVVRPHSRRCQRRILCIDKDVLCCKNTMGKVFGGLAKCLNFNEFFFKKTMRIEKR